jgi:hypothetical protein
VISEIVASSESLLSEPDDDVVVNTGPPLFRTEAFSAIGGKGCSASSEMSRTAAT